MAVSVAAAAIGMPVSVAAAATVTPASSKCAAPSNTAAPAVPPVEAERPAARAPLPSGAPSATGRWGTSDCLGRRIAI
jgi:hypothetical protein